MSILKIRNSSNTGWIDAASATGFRIRNQSNSGWINKTANLSGFSVRNSTNDGWITFNPYSISPSVTSVNEGGVVTYTISTSGIGDGTVLYWTNSGTTTGADFVEGTNSGSVTISSNTASIVRTLTNDATTEGSETIVIQLRTGSVAGPVVATAATVTVTDSSTSPAFPTSFVMEKNDLEFIYTGIQTSSVNTAYMEITFTIDTSGLWSFLPYSTDHIVFALDPRGDSSVFAPNGTRDHCGPITRHGVNLWDEARGFILDRAGNIKAEQWYAGSGFGLYDLGTHFNPLDPSNYVLTVRLRGGYRTGVLGERMELDIFRGTNTSGTLLNSSSLSWGWDWNGQHRFALAAICSDFVSPNSTGCVESTRLGTSYGGAMSISNFNFTVVQ